MKKARPFVSGVPSKFARQRGASLLEGIAYLGIAALVVLGAVSLLTGAFGSAKANQTTEEVVALRTAVRKLYTGQPYDATAAMTANMISAKAIPNTLVVAGAAISNGWGGAVTLAGVAGTFTITYEDVPQDVCVSVVSGANGWTRIARDAAGAGQITVFPATATLATTLCNAATNTIVFTAT